MSYESRKQIYAAGEERGARDAREQILDLLRDAAESEDVEAAVGALIGRLEALDAKASAAVAAAKYPTPGDLGPNFDPEAFRRDMARSPAKAPAPKDIGDQIADLMAIQRGLPGARTRATFVADREEPDSPGKRTRDLFAAALSGGAS